MIIRKASEVVQIIRDERAQAHMKEISLQTSFQKKNLPTPTTVVDKVQREITPNLFQYIYIQQRCKFTQFFFLTHGSVYHDSMLIKRSNLTQQYADIYLLQSHSTCFGRHSTHYQEY